jgi:sortase A
MISRIFLGIGIACLALYGFFTVQAYLQQEALNKELDESRVEAVKPSNKPSASARSRIRALQEGDLFGRLEIPGVELSVMVMEGDSDRTLRLGAGHIPGTALAIAGHRDTFFRPLKDIKLHDTIRLTTPDGVTEYRVVSTKIVGPKDISVLDNDSDDILTLVTCYPFYYVGPAPQRFIVQATKN